jgi:hypothetical protein
MALANRMSDTRFIAIAAIGYLQLKISVNSIIVILIIGNIQSVGNFNKKEQ